MSVLHFQKHFTKGIVLEIYEKAIANLGPLNLMYAKEIFVEGSKINQEHRDVYTASLTEFRPYRLDSIRGGIDELMGPLVECRLTRTPLVRLQNHRREIYLRNMNGNTTRVEVRDHNNTKECSEILIRILGNPISTE